MPSEQIFPDLGDWEPTHQTLHLYSKVAGAVPRALLKFQSRWQHISQAVERDGLATKKIPLPGGGNFRLKIDLRQHVLRLEGSHEARREFSMQEGWSANQMAEQVFGAVADLGLTGEYERKMFDSDEPRHYDAAVAGRFLTALVNANRIFEEHRASLEGDVGPVQLWPHGFDMSVEWFGSRAVEYEENGRVERYPSQLNLGFSLGEPSHPEPYFYSNPWPFEEAITEQPLPAGATWFTESWQGSLLPYAELAGAADAEERLKEYAWAVYEISKPTLMSD